MAKFTKPEFKAYLSGPRWVDLETKLKWVAYMHSVTLRIDKVEKKWLYKKVHFTVTDYYIPNLNEFKEFLGAYNTYKKGII